MPTLLLLRPKKQGPGDGYGAFGPDGNRCVNLYKSWGWPTQIVEIDAMKVRDTLPVTEKAASLAARRAATIAAIETSLPQQNINAIVIACHGWSNGIQLGFDLKTVRQLAKAIAKRSSTTEVTVSLNACSTALGGVAADGGFCDALRDALCVEGLVDCRVEGHTTIGHAFANPFLVRSAGEGSLVGGMGGYYHVDPKSKLFPTFRKLMRTTNLRFGIWSLDDVAIRDIVAHGKRPTWLTKNVDR